MSRINWNTRLGIILAWMIYQTRQATWETTVSTLICARRPNSSLNSLRTPFHQFWTLYNPLRRNKKLTFSRRVWTRKGRLGTHIIFASSLWIKRMPCLIVLWFLYKMTKMQRLNLHLIIKTPWISMIHKNTCWISPKNNLSHLKSKAMPKCSLFHLLLRWGQAINWWPLRKRKPRK